MLWPILFNGLNILNISEPLIISVFVITVDSKNWWWFQRTFHFVSENLWGKETLIKKQKPNMSITWTIAALRNMGRNNMMKF